MDTGVSLQDIPTLYGICPDETRENQVSNLSHAWCAARIDMTWVAHIVRMQRYANQSIKEINRMVAIHVTYGCNKTSNNLSFPK